MNRILQPDSEGHYAALALRIDRESRRARPRLSSGQQALRAHPRKQRGGHHEGRGRVRRLLHRGQPHRAGDGGVMSLL